jgi:hypothetical protein
MTTALAPRLRSALLLAVLACAGSGAMAAEPDRGPAWASLNAHQKQALAPLQRDWPGIDAQRKQKWLEVASRFPAMAEDERDRVRERMAEWARLTPAERTRARLQFQETRQVSADERAARWQAYQALSPEERQKLAQRAKPAARPPGEAPRTTALAPKAGPVAAVDQGKHNLVATTSTPPPKAVAPAVVQARPGATTTTMSTRVAPPAHHQAGLPKIAATSGFVDPATLLPKRGPQGAAVRAAASGTPASQP